MGGKGIMKMQTLQSSMLSRNRRYLYVIYSCFVLRLEASDGRGNVVLFIHV